MAFSKLSLHPDLQRALATEGYTSPTPIQKDAIPPILDGHDIMGCAQTGTGKTAAFALPILQHLICEPKPASTRTIRSLVLAPTRELAAQIHISFNSYGRHTGLRYAVIFGGVKQGRQVDALRSGVDVLIATPGRLLDLMNQGYVRLNALRHLVLDEADNMLDMGFIHDIRKIISRIPKQRQTLMFSATMPPEIKSLAHTILQNPVHVQVAPVSSTVELVGQSVIHVDKGQKPALLVHQLRTDGAIKRVLVFSRTKHGADKIAKQLIRSGIHAAAIHGNKSQNARVRALMEFKGNKPPVLVATDIAARGLDIDEVTHVINYDLPNVPETYVHRIGRTGRAGATGIAISFCDHEERAYLRDIEKLTRQKIPTMQLPENLPAVKPATVARGANETSHEKPFRHENHRPQAPQAQARPAGQPQQRHSPAVQTGQKQTPRHQQLAQRHQQRSAGHFDPIAKPRPSHPAPARPHAHKQGGGFHHNSPRGAGAPHPQAGGSHPAAKRQHPIHGPRVGGGVRPSAPHQQRQPKRKRNWA